MWNCIALRVHWQHPVYGCDKLHLKTIYSIFERIARFLNQFNFKISIKYNIYQKNVKYENDISHTFCVCFTSLRYCNQVYGDSALKSLLKIFWDVSHFLCLALRVFSLVSRFTVTAHLTFFGCFQTFRASSDSEYATLGLYSIQLMLSWAFQCPAGRQDLRFGMFLLAIQIQAFSIQLARQIAPGYSWIWKFFESKNI